MLSGLENPLHLLILCAVLLLAFGAKRLPEMGRSIGTGMREFKSGFLNREPAPQIELSTSPRSAPVTAPSPSVADTTDR